MRWGVVTGLKSEARLAEAAARQAGAQQSVLVRCEGPGLVQARIAARALVAEGAKGLLSLGLAGALAPKVPPGTLLLPKEILDETGLRYAASAEEHSRARACFGTETVREDPLLGMPSVVATIAEKATLAQRFSAVGVDMESAGVAEVAQELGVPMLALRAIADPSDRAIPTAAQVGMSEDGSVNAFAVLAELLMSPAVVPDVVQLARDTAMANAALSRAARLLFLGLCVAR